MTQLPSSRHAAFATARSAFLCVAFAAAASASFAQAAAVEAPSVQVAFSPDAGAETLVLRSIESAHASIRLAAYSFTAPRVVKALVDAKRRGVDVAVVVDMKNNLSDDRSGKSRAALNLLVNAGIPTRTISAYAIFHDKFAVIDGKTVETGSFNYSEAAAHRNSENVIVIWNSPPVAAQYLEHWTDRWNKGVAYTSSY